MQFGSLREVSAGSSTPSPSGETMRTGSRLEESRGSRRAYLASLIWAAVALGVAPRALTADPNEPRRVVVLYPVSDGQPGIVRFDQGLRATLKSSTRETIEIYNEYIDAARFGDEAYQRRLADFLREKYAGRRIDVVIPALAPSLDFVLRYRDRLFPGIPVVFGAVEKREVETKALGPGITGSPMKLDLESTLETALRLQPGTRRVAVVAGNSATDSYWISEARKAFRGHEGKVEFVYLTGLPMDELLREVARLPERTIIYYLHVFEDGRGETFVPAEVAERLSGSANAPVYGLYRTYLGRGIVGGRLVSFEDEGEKAARLVSRILAGEVPEDVALSEASQNPFLFDWRQLRRWGIREDALPDGSVVLYKEPGFWDLYGWRIFAIVLLCVVEAVLIVGLLVERARRRRADDRFRQAVVASPSGMIMIGTDGRIVLVNEQVERLFGYHGDELVGGSVDLLVPERFRDRHPGHRGCFFATPASRPMGVGRELYGRRKDGSEFPVEIELNPIRTGETCYVLASVIDITERKRADEDLRESQRELRALTGRLLKAQEDERRRIARELHDDLNQDLALLAVHLDLLGQRPPETSAELGERVKAMSDRVKQLSSAVHDLSTVLHPSKLEQLGLVAGIRGLCHELIQAHGLPIEFSRTAGAISDLERHRALPVPDRSRGPAERHQAQWGSLCSRRIKRRRGWPCAADRR